MSTILIALEPKAFTQEQIAQIKTLAPDREIIVSHNREKMQEHLQDVEVAAGGFPHEWIERAPKLRWFQQWGAGANWLMDHPEAIEKDFVLTNASGVHSIPISEHIMAFLLAFARDLPNSFATQKAHDWKRGKKSEVFELAGKTLLLIGVGAIGQRTAQIASALGMKVWGIRRNPAEKAEGIEKMVGPEELDQLLPEADFIVLTVPETPETLHMIDAKAFDKMKSGAYIVNIGRGGTIDEQAMIEALQSGKLGGAGLDVFETEPLPEDSPLWDQDNVIITAHYSGSTPYYDQRAMNIFIENLERYVKGEPLVNVVDKKLGY